MTLSGRLRPAVRYHLGHIFDSSQNDTPMQVGSTLQETCQPDVRAIEFASQGLMEEGY